MANEMHVVFGTGPLGKWTARELVKLGKKVKMVNRSGKLTGMPAEVEVTSADAYDLKQNLEVTRNAAVVYQCAQPLYHEWAEKFPAFQAAILEAAAQNGAKLIVADNLYMYGDAHSEPLKEDSPVQPLTKKGQIRAKMARSILDAHQKGNVQAAIGRASNFFGPDDHVVTDLAIRPALLGKSLNLLGKLDQPHTFTYIVDFGRLLAALGTRDDAMGQIWFTPSPAAITQAEFISILEKEIGKPVKVMLAGKTMLRMLGIFDPMIRETVEMVYEWTQPFVMNSDKAQKAFGLQPTPFSTAIKETVAWLRKDLENSKK